MKLGLLRSSLVELCCRAGRMLHSVQLSGGRATAYRNRWVETEQLATGAMIGAPGRANNASNVSVIHHGGKLLSSGEVGTALV